MIAVFPAKIDHLYTMLQWICAAMKGAGVNDEVAYKVELASEEIIVNIILHGYCDYPGDIEITVNMIDSTTIEICFKDNGIAHNPLTSAQKLDRSLERVGGHGVALILSIMDSVVYERQGLNNILRVTCYQ